MKITVKAPAKINLYLDVTGKRDDGYHNIESIMQTVTLFDEVTVENAPDNGITMTCTNPYLACGEKNLCIRAARMFFDYAKIKNAGLKIHVVKRIPLCAGLGGGSTDAAAVFIALNEIYKTGFSENELCALGGKLGADIPFCIKKGISITRGIGEIFSPCDTMPDCNILIACKGKGISTPWAYSELDKMLDYSSRNTSCEQLAEYLNKKDIDKLCKNIHNIFECVTEPCRPNVTLIKKVMADSGALRAVMSGSGPSVFGIFKDVNSMLIAQNALSALHIDSYPCKPYY